MRSLFLRSIVVLLGLAPFASSVAAEKPEKLPLSHAGISLLAQPRDDGWALHFQLANVVDGAQIRYRRFGAEEWRTLPQTGELVGPLEVGPIGTGEQIIEAEVIDQEGEGRGRFRLSFDPEKERIRQARYLLDHVLTNNWVNFRDAGEAGTYVYYGTVWSRRDALRSIRYSLDGCAFDRTADGEDGYSLLAGRFTYVCMQLVYADGESSPSRIFLKERPVLSRHRPSGSSGPNSMTLPESGAGSSEPVRLRTSRANNGWTLGVEVDDWAAVAEVRYRLESDAAWRSAGELPWINPTLGRRSANPDFVLDPLRVAFGRQKIEVQLVAPDGGVSGPYTLWFDPEWELLAAAKADLGDPGRAWGSFEQANSRGVPFYLAVFDARDSLREIRYSVDDCGVGQKFEFPPWNDIAVSPPNPDNTILWMPKETAFACVQLVFTDGTESEVRRFENGVAEEEIVVEGEDPDP